MASAGNIVIKVDCDEATGKLTALLEALDATTLRVSEQRHEGENHPPFEEGGENRPPQFYVWPQDPQLDRCDFIHPAEPWLGRPEIQCVSTATWFVSNATSKRSACACTEHLGGVSKALSSSVRSVEPAS